LFERDQEFPTDEIKANKNKDEIFENDSRTCRRETAAMIDELSTHG